MDLITFEKLRDVDLRRYGAVSLRRREDELVAEVWTRITILMAGSRGGPVPPENFIKPTLYVLVDEIIADRIAEAKGIVTELHEREHL